MLAPVPIEQFGWIRAPEAAQGTCGNHGKNTSGKDSTRTLMQGPKLFDCTVLGRFSPTYVVEIDWTPHLTRGTCGECSDLGVEIGEDRLSTPASQFHDRFRAMTG